MSAQLEMAAASPRRGVHRHFKSSFGDLTGRRFGRHDWNSD
jgi:hypothetical protein